MPTTPQDEPPEKPKTPDIEWDDGNPDDHIDANPELYTPKAISERIAQMRASQPRPPFCTLTTHSSQLRPTARLKSDVGHEEMERIFDTFREASQEAARICRDRETGASLKRRDDRWVVVFDSSISHEGSPPAGPDPLVLENDFLLTELQRMQDAFASLERANKDLRSRISVLELEHALVKPLLVRDTPSPFVKCILDRTPRENVETI